METSTSESMRALLDELQSLEKQGHADASFAVLG